MARTLGILSLIVESNAIVGHETFRSIFYRRPNFKVPDPLVFVAVGFDVGF